MVIGLKFNMYINKYNKEQLDEHIAQCIQLMKAKRYNKNNPTQWVEWLEYILDSLEDEIEYVQQQKS
jgi:hypothetical protein